MQDRNSGLASAAGLVLVCLFLTSCDSSPSGSIDSPGGALERSLTYLGVDKSRVSCNLSEDVTVVSLSNDETPFLRHRADSTRLWKIILDGIGLLGIENERGEEQISRDCRVYIDSLTGDLYKIEFLGAPMAPHEIGILTAETAENQLRRSGEVYVGYPDVAPVVDFREACTPFVFAAMSAKQVEALYVSYKLGDKDPFPAWVITLRGLPEWLWVSPRGVGAGTVERIPPNQLNHIRYIIDARSGKRVMSSTRPQYRMTDKEPPTGPDSASR